MYVAMLYFVFMEAIVSPLINGENIIYVCNPCCLLRFTVLWARVGMGHVCPSFARNRVMPLCFICFSLCVGTQLMDQIDVLVSCMMIREPTLCAHLYQVLHTVVLPGLTRLNFEGARLNR